MAPSLKVRTPVSLVVVLTVALAATLAVAGTGLLVVLDALYAHQVKANLILGGQRQADYLSEDFSQMLWNFTFDEVTAVGNAVVQDETVAGLTVRTEEGRVVFQLAKPTPALLTIHRTLRYQGMVVGDFSLVLSSKALQAEESALLGASLGAFLGLTALVLVVTPFFLSRTLLRPFSRLASALGNPGPGPFADLPEPSSRIRELRTFETALFALNRAVARQVDDLEARVEARTRELREAQERLVRTETLATLGQLAAGLAHELNTPLGAISSSTRYLETELHEAVIPTFAPGLTLEGSHDKVATLDRLARLAANLERSPSPGERRTLAAQWKALGGSPDSELFDLATTTGLGEHLENLARWSDHPHDERVVRLISQWARSLAIIHLASDKAAAVVSALRAQVQSGTKSTTQPIELRREIDQALALLQNRTKQGIRVELTGPSEVWILGEPNELGKVWLNLMLNGIQAMEGQGTLSIRITIDDPWAVVEIQDTGPGIAPDVLPRIFEPFFTTKSTGMGLGLEITQRIVEKDGGTIQVQSMPGRTVFRVALPLASPRTKPSDAS